DSCYGRKIIDAARTERGSLQSAWIVESPDGVIAFLVVGERHSVGAPCPRDCRAVLRDGANPTQHVRYLIVLARRKIVKEDVRHGGAIGDEGQLTTIR